MSPISFLFVANLNKEKIQVSEHSKANLVFQSEVIFLQLDELDKLDRITHA